MLPPSYLALLVLAVCAEGVLAVDDVDEMIAVIVFAVLIVIFTVISIFFLVMIIKLKRKQRLGDNRQKKQRGIVRINSNHVGVVGIKPRHEPRHTRPRTLSEGSTSTNPSTVVNYAFDHQTSHDPLLSSSTTFRQTSNGDYNNSMYSSQLSQGASSETTIAVFTPTPTPGAGLSTVPESHDPNSSPPDYYQLYNRQKPQSSSDVTVTVGFEEKEQLSTSPEIEKQPLPPAEVDHNGAPPQLHHTDDDPNTLEHESSAFKNEPHPPAEALEHNGSPPQIQSDGGSVNREAASSNRLEHATFSENQPHPPSETLEHNGSLPHVQTSNDNSTREMQGKDKTTDNAVTNGAAGVGASISTATSSEDDSTRENITYKKKKGILKGLIGKKKKPRTDSQKRLLNSQSSVTTPGDSPPQLKANGTAGLPETFYEEDEQVVEDTAITMNDKGMYIPYMEETSL